MCMWGVGGKVGVGRERRERTYKQLCITQFQMQERERRCLKIKLWKNAFTHGGNHVTSFE